MRVASSTVIAQHLLVPSMPGLHRRHPHLRMELEVSDRLADMARDGIDIAIRTGTSVPATMVARQIGTLGRALYAAPAYLRDAGTPQRPDELAQHRLVTNSAAPHYNHWPFIVDGEPLTLSMQGHWRCSDTGVVVTMVVQGLGVGRLATLVGEPLVRDGRLVPVLPARVDTQPVPIYAVTAPTRQRLPKIRACIEHWAEWIGSAAS